MISKHISDREGVYSITATRLGIDNKPNEEQLNNMKLIAKEVFDEFKGSVTTETVTGLPEEESKVEEQEPKMRGLMARGE